LRILSHLVSGRPPEYFDHRLFIKNLKTLNKK
jgi:hypothetical protein